MRRLILASASPRRREILKAMGLDFTVVPSDFEEYLDDSRSVEEISRELGLGKARAVALKYPDAYVIGSDTIVIINGIQLAKPMDGKEALKMLQMLSGRVHKVETSLAIVCVDQKFEWVESATSEVLLDKMTVTELKDYIATGDPFDKAGGYALRHPLIRPHATIKSGELSTVLGLPVTLLTTMLTEIGINVPNDIDATMVQLEKTSFKDLNYLV